MSQWNNRPRVPGGILVQETSYHMGDNLRWQLVHRLQQAPQGENEFQNVVCYDFETFDLGVPVNG